MTATSSAFQTSIRWSTAPEAASAASFHPSKAAMRTGERSCRSSSISITRLTLCRPPEPGTPLTRCQDPVSREVGLVGSPTVESRLLPTGGPTVTVTAPLTAALQERILVMDRAMGTMVQRQGLAEGDYR